MKRKGEQKLSCGSSAMSWCRWFFNTSPWQTETLSKHKMGLVSLSMFTLSLRSPADCWNDIDNSQVLEFLVTFLMTAPRLVPDAQDTFSLRSDTLFHSGWTWLFWDLLNSSWSGSSSNHLVFFVQIVLLACSNVNIGKLGIMEKVFFPGFAECK